MKVQKYIKIYNMTSGNVYKVITENKIFCSTLKIGIFILFCHLVKSGTVKGNLLCLYQDNITSDELAPRKICPV